LALGPDAGSALDWPGGWAWSEEWTQEQEQALAQIIGQLLLRHQWLSSAEFLQILPPLAKEDALEVRSSAPPAVSSPPGGEMPRPLQFWFNVNADLVVYGATEPDARVTIGGRPIQLRPDGSFSYRFTLPDGEHHLSLAASSIHGDERQAKLRLQRTTDYRGAVGQPPDTGLSPPPVP
jgi:hypothetical protein